MRKVLVMMLAMLTMVAAASEAFAKPAEKINKEEVTQAFRDSAVKFGICANMADHEGVVKISFVVNPKGKVTKVRLDDSFGKKADSCIKKAVEKMKFSASGASVPINNFPVNIQKKSKDKSVAGKSDNNIPVDIQKKSDAKAVASKSDNGLSKSEITSAIRSGAKGFKECSRNSSEKGTMKVSFVIKPNGTTSGHKNITPEFKNTDTERCVIDVIKGIKFPEFEGSDIPISNYPIAIM